MILTILVFFLILSLLVFIHELGHFTVAKKLGIEVEEFGFGLPPRIWGKKIGETIYSINWLPIGGFVKLAGEDQAFVSDEELKAMSKEKRRRYFFARSKKERAAVLLAGVTMNFVLAVIIISYIFTQGVLVPTGKIIISEVTPDSPAAIAGLTKDDKILEVNGKKVSTNDEFIALTKAAASEQKELEILVERNGSDTPQFKVLPRKDPPPGQGALGVAITEDTQELKYPWYSAPFYGMIWAFKFSYQMLALLFGMLWKLITFQSIDPRMVSGPVGIAQATGEAVKVGFDAVLRLTGLLSLNLAVMNILPIPALDGGRLLFVIFEKFLGRRVKPSLEAAAHQIGMMILLGLIALVTINDVVRIARGG